MQGGCDDFLNGENGTIMVTWSVVTISDSNQWNHRICVCIESNGHYWVFIAHPGLALIDVHEEEISQSLS